MSLALVWFVGMIRSEPPLTSVTIRVDSREHKWCWCQLLTGAE
jgi:hypothetical protein